VGSAAGRGGRRGSSSAPSSPVSAMVREAIRRAAVGAVRNFTAASASASKRK
jgi:hypothetical protein